MELEKLKSAWHSVDERLKKQKLLEEHIIREMIYSKSGRALNRLINYETFGFAVLLALVPFIAWQYSLHGGKALFVDILLIYSEISLITALVMQVYSLKKLSKIDVTKQFGENIRLISEYSILVKKVYNAVCIIFVPLFIVLFVTAGIVLKVVSWRWGAGLFGVIVGLLAAYWEYKRIYLRNINIIRQSMEELRMLDENKDDFQNS